MFPVVRMLFSLLIQFKHSSLNITFSAFCLVYLWINSPMYLPVLNTLLSIHMFPIPSSALHRQCGYYILEHNPTEIKIWISPETVWIIELDISSFVSHIIHSGISKKRKKQNTVLGKESRSWILAGMILSVRFYKHS